MNWRAGILTIALAFSQSNPVRVPVEGIVQDARTAAPINGAQVRLSGTLPGETRPTIISGVSGRDGTFRLLAPPGAFTLTAQRDGYFGKPVYGVWQAAASRTIDVRPDNPPAPSTLKLTGTGVITGQIVDHNGKPAARLPVAAMQWRYTDGRPGLVVANSGATNERGEYRLFWLPPGDYVVAFNPPPSSLLTPIITTETGQSLQTLTFYPGTTDSTRAQNISVTSGAEIRNISFAVQTVPVFTISGRVDGISPPTSMPAFSLLSREGVTPSTVFISNANTLSLELRQQGLFEFGAIRQGAYDLIATVPGSAGQPAQSGQVSITVGPQDLKDITIRMEPVFELHGRLVPQGIQMPESTTVRLSAEGRTNLPLETRTGANGEFRFANLPAGAYRLVVALPDDAFVAGLASNVFHLPAQAGEPLTLSVRGNAGRITGMVTNADGQVGIDTTVVLVPDPPFRVNSMLFVKARPDEAGRFQAAGIAPGNYKVFAWEGVPNTAWLNADFLSRHENSGTPLMIEAGSTKDIRLVAIPYR